MMIPGIAEDVSERLQDSELRLWLRHQRVILDINQDQRLYRHQEQDAHPGGPGGIGHLRQGKYKPLIGCSYLNYGLFRNNEK